MSFLGEHEIDFTLAGLKACLDGMKARGVTSHPSKAPMARGVHTDDLRSWVRASTQSRIGEGIRSRAAIGETTSFWRVRLPRRGGRARSHGPYVRFRTGRAWCARPPNPGKAFRRNSRCPTLRAFPRPGVQRRHLPPPTLHTCCCSRAGWRRGRSTEPRCGSLPQRPRTPAAFPGLLRRFSAGH